MYVKQSIIIFTYKCTHIIILYLIVFLFMPLLYPCLCLYNYYCLTSDVHGDPPYNYNNYYKNAAFLIIKTLVVMDSVVSILLLSLISAAVSETGYQVIFSRNDDVVTNTFTLRCLNTTTGVVMLSGSLKYFVTLSSLNRHTCTVAEVENYVCK